MLIWINRKFEHVSVWVIVLLMLGGGILATEGTVYLLLEFFFVDLPLRPALVITFIVTVLVTPPPPTRSIRKCIY